MKRPDPARMAEAARLTREGKLQEAMALLAGIPAPETTIEGVIDMAPPSDGKGAWTAHRAPQESASALDGLMDRLKAHLPNGMTSKTTQVAIPDGASFDGHTFGNAAGQRPYKLYVPAKTAPNPALFVMLHGCTQSPDDFAAGTRMNILAEEHGFLVAYPGQTQHANAQKCWNWFNPNDQQRGDGEPAILAGITREIMARHGIAPHRVYIAGLSAGGAQAAIMGSAYPDLYAGVGVHSGLACGIAKDMPSAFAAMKQGAAAGVKANGTFVRTIVFHGDSDNTVHAINSEQVVKQVRARAKLHKVSQGGVSPGGVRYTRTTESNAAGRPVLEHWLLHGAGHAWSGGSADGSYTDPRGPDASREMVRFFMTT